MMKTLEIKTDNYDKEIYNKLQEAEAEMNNTSKRYSKEEILKSINDIILDNQG